MSVAGTDVQVLVHSKIENRHSKIVLFSTQRRSFIEADLKVLRESGGEVERMVGSGRRTMRQVRKAAQEADVAICWFASVYSLPLVLGARKGGGRSIVIVGGADAAAMPELGYGIWLSAARRPVLRAALKRADLILPVDIALQQNLRRLSGLDLPQSYVLPTGYDVEYWSPLADEQLASRIDDRDAPEVDTVDLFRARSIGPIDVLAVASCDSRRRGLVKGIDLFCDAARALPDRHFTIVGVSRDALDRFGFDPPENLRAIEECEQRALRDLYRRASIYCQTSRHEGLPNALCEALLCGTPAVASDVGGTVRALGEGGELVESGRLDGIIEAIDHLLRLDDAERAAIGAAGRHHVASTFSLGRRRRGLIAAVKGEEMPDGGADG